jgi:hypothetical protein
MKTGRGVRKGSYLSPILFNLCCKCLTKKALEEYGDIKIGEHVIRTVEYADDLVLPTSETFEMWCWRRMKKISWTENGRSKALQRGKEERNILYTV